MNPEAIFIDEEQIKSPETARQNLILEYKDDILYLLENAHYISKGRIEEIRPEIGQHSNEVFLVEYLDNDSEKIKKQSNLVRFFEIFYKNKKMSAIFKPQAGESRKMLADYNIRKMYPREVGAYAVDYLGGFGIVPPTVFKTIEGEIGSLQLYIPPEVADAPKRIPNVNWNNIYEHPDFKKLTILDRLIINCDRNDTNLLARIDNSGGLFAIDHGTCFCSTKRNDVRIGQQYFAKNPSKAELNEEDRTILNNIINSKDLFLQTLDPQLEFLFEGQTEDIFEISQTMLKTNSLLVPFKYTI